MKHVNHPDILQGAIAPRCEIRAAFTLTKRDSESSGMARSADPAIEAIWHGQARAIGVPAMGRGLQWQLTDRNAAGDFLSHFMTAAQALDAVHK
jgi:hypothetical protein